MYLCSAVMPTLASRMCLVAMTGRDGTGWDDPSNKVVCFRVKG
jgi:hypothetical protein